MAFDYDSWRDRDIKAKLENRPELPVFALDKKANTICIQEIKYGESPCFLYNGTTIATLVSTSRFSDMVTRIVYLPSWGYVICDRNSARSGQKHNYICLYN